MKIDIPHKLPRKFRKAIQELADSGCSVEICLAEAICDAAWGLDKDEAIKAAIGEAEAMRCAVVKLRQAVIPEAGDPSSSRPARP